MTRNVEVVRPDASLAETPQKLDQLNVGHLPVNPVFCYEEQADRTSARVLEDVSQSSALDR
jgi:hypothetical protein